MPYAIYAVKREHIGKIDEVLKDDLVSRQSIAVRDAKVLGVEKEARMVIVEGTPEAITKADEIFKAIAEREKEEDAKKIYEAFRALEDSVASGIGMIFQ
jgi:rubrerythrin